MQKLWADIDVSVCTKFWGSRPFYPIPPSRELMPIDTFCRSYMYWGRSRRDLMTTVLGLMINISLKRQYALLFASVCCCQVLSSSCWKYSL